LKARWNCRTSLFCWAIGTNSVPLGTQADLARPADWSILAAKIGSSAQLFKLGMRIVTEGADSTLGEIPMRVLAVPRTYGGRQKRD